jgi:polyhydroxybutyrate depolymerase
MRKLLLLPGAALLLIAVFACDDGATDGSSSSGDPSFGTSSGQASSSGDGSSGNGSSGNSKPKETFVVATEETMEHGGRTRRYILAKPKDYDENKSYPLVLSFHGNPGTHDGMANGLPFDSASKGEAVIAYPAAASGDWDIYTPTDSNADMNFIRALVDEIKGKVNIDGDRVFAFGYSGGGFFITHFVCRFGGVFKAISVNAGGGPDEEQMGYDQRDNGCYICPGGPIATLVTHGANDTEVETASGEFTATCFASTNECGGSRSATTPEPCELYDGCPDDKPVKRCIIPGLGHGPWRDAMKEAWAFFESLP